MKLPEATELLREKLILEYETDQEISWTKLKTSFYVALIKMPSTMLVATWSPLVGLTIFDSVFQNKGNEWIRF